MAKCSSNVEKRRIPNTFLYHSSCRGGILDTYCNLTWTIPRPFTLKNGVVYGQRKNGVYVVFFRERSSFTLMMTTIHYPYKVEFGIVLDRTGKSVFFVPEESPKGIFKMEFDRYLRDSSNTFLKEGTLVLQFGFGARHGRCIHVRPTGGVGNFSHQASEVITSMPATMADNRFSDLVVRVEEKEFRVHKPLMIVRSPYFRVFVEENCNGDEDVEMHLDTTCETFCAVLSYIYTGSVAMEYVIDVIRIIELADKLQIRHLVYLCGLWLEAKLDESNFGRIRNVAVEYKMKRLINSADTFLSRNVSVNKP